MPVPKLLWINDNAAVQSQTEWQEIFSKFDVISVTELAAARAVLAGEDVDCALVHGPVRDGDPARVLEVLRGADEAVPVVFYDLEMTAAEAVRLYRFGAYH